MARTRTLPLVLFTVGAALAAGSVSVFSSPIATPATPHPTATLTVPSGGDDHSKNRRSGLGEVWTTLDGPAIYAIR